MTEESQSETTGYLGDIWEGDHPDLSGRRILVLGAGISGLTTALLLRECGAEVVKIDSLGTLNPLTGVPLVVLYFAGLFRRHRHDGAVS